MDRPTPTALPLSPLLGALVVALAVLAVLRVRGARRRDEAVPRWRIGLATAGILLCAAVTLTPVESVAAGGYLLSAHLLQIIVLMGVTPPLLLIGLPPGGRPWPAPLAAVGRAAVHPAVAIVLVNGVFLGVHVPALYDAGLAHPAVYEAQLVALLGVSVLFWWPIVEPRGPGRRSLPPLFKLGFILLATIPQTFAGLLFALANHPIYAAYRHAPSLLGFSPMSDQQLAGTGMALLPKLALFTAFSVILWRMFDADGRDDEAQDDGGPGGDDDDAPTPVRPPMPAWLGMLDRGPMTEEPAPARRRERVTLRG